jgi:hypothetical protein
MLISKQSQSPIELQSPHLADQLSPHTNEFYNICMHIIQILMYLIIRLCFYLRFTDVN